MSDNVLSFNDMLKSKSGNVKLVEGSEKIRADKCLASIQETLRMFDCAMVPMLVLGPRGVQQASVQIVPVPRTPVKMAAPANNEGGIVDNVG